ncbi:uncharacterized protein PG998_003025 [Apiospora kogelbergensis]|uniref:uncharacterized protein n=1 Tax=Apiospora kogelbergensis TaxID=1337665 RepID=UPI003131A941
MANRVPNTTQVVPGASVSIVLKADQRTGREVQGVVRDVLTRGDHHRGIKVRLADGRIGRVQRLAPRPAEGPEAPGETAPAAHPPPPAPHFRGEGASGRSIRTCGSTATSNRRPSRSIWRRTSSLLSSAVRRVARRLRTTRRPTTRLQPAARDPMRTSLLTW